MKDNSVRVFTKPNKMPFAIFKKFEFNGDHVLQLFQSYLQDRKQ